MVLNPTFFWNSETSRQNVPFVQVLPAGNKRICCIKAFGESHPYSPLRTTRNTHNSIWPNNFREFLKIFSTAITQFF